MSNKKERLIGHLKSVVAYIESQNYIKASYVLGLIISDLDHEKEREEDCECEEEENEYDKIHKDFGILLINYLKEKYGQKD